MSVVWNEYMAPFEVPKDYNYPLSFRELVSEQLAASYFCRVWSQVRFDNFRSCISEDSLETFSFR